MTGVKRDRLQCPADLRINDLKVQQIRQHPLGKTTERSEVNNSPWPSLLQVISHATGAKLCFFRSQICITAPVKSALLSTH